MHYYKRNLGDYAKKAGRLSMLQHGAYTLLIDSCYDREVFPTLEEAIDWTWASSKEEVEAVEFVLSKFFTLQDDGTYVQQRIEEELESYKITGLINQLVALSREAKKKGKQPLANSYDRLRLEIKDAPLSKSHAAWTSVVDTLINQHETAPNHKPLTTNQEPLTNNHKPITNNHKPITNNHKPITNNQDKKINKKESPPAPVKWGKKRFGDELIKLGANPVHVADWMTCRKTFTETSFKSTIKHASTAGKTIAEVVELCAEKGWQGFDAKYLADNRRQHSAPFDYRKAVDQSGFGDSANTYDGMIIPNQQGFLEHE